jgi:hypothetical protein
VVEIELSILSVDDEGSSNDISSGSSQGKSPDNEIKVSSCHITLIFQTLLTKLCRNLLMPRSHFYKVIRILAKEEKKREALKLGDWPKVCDPFILQMTFA